MPNPNITQTTPNSPYNITNSKGLMADLVLSAGALETRFINLSMATAAAGLVIELVQNGPSIRIVAISGGMGSDSTVPGFEVGWGVAKEFRGKGYAVEAARASIDWVYATFEVGEIIHCIEASNEPSKGVARRLGARRDGEVDLFGKTNERWVTSRATWKG